MHVWEENQEVLFATLSSRGASDLAASLSGCLCHVHDGKAAVILTERTNTVTHTLLPSLRHRGLEIANLEGIPRLALFVMFAGSILVPLIVVGSQGNFVLGAVFLGLIIVALVTFYRLDWGFLLWFALVMAADGYDIPGFGRTPLFSVHYLQTLNTTVPGLGIGFLAPIEFHMVFFVCALFFVGALGKRIHRTKVTLGYAAAAFVGWLVFSLLYGKYRGGDIQMGGWETRALVFFPITFFLVRQVITTKEQLVNLVWVCIIMVGVKSFQAVVRFAGQGFSFGGSRAMANHEDAAFIVTLMILLLGMAFFKYDRRQRNALIFMLPLLSLALFVANRRAAYVSFAVCLVGFPLLLSRDEQRRILKGYAIFAVGFCVYLAMFWNSYGRASMVAQAVKSAIFADDKQMTRSDDFASSLARRHENYCLSVTFQKAPVLGIGFGNKHEWPIKAYGEFSLKGYITHNQILWLLTKTGAVGFFFFLFFLNLIVMHGAQVLAALNNPYFRALCAVCVLAVLNQIVVSYVDMQLTFYRNMVYLGTLTGLIPTLKILDDKEKEGPLQEVKAYD